MVPAAGVIWRTHTRRAIGAAFCILLTVLTGSIAIVACATPSERIDFTPAIGTESLRRGDEIVVAGRMFHTGTPVVLWIDPPNYDAYRTDRRFARPGESAWDPERGPESPTRYASRDITGDPNRLEDLQAHIDQVVVHYDAAGTSRQCFKILHDLRGLSSHFLLDLDGTIYQTLDLKERAWHATIANGRSIGIEIANIGAYPIVDDPNTRVTTPMVESSPLADWYARDKDGYFLTLPNWLGDGGYRTPGYLATSPRPSRPEPITSVIQGQVLTQFDLTDAQYDALAKLLTTLREVFPNIKADYPRDADGDVLTRALTPDEFKRFQGVLGHYHVQENKLDPGPAFDWDRALGSR